MGRRSDPFITVRCPTCAAPRQTTTRSVRRRKQEGRTLECDVCLRISSVEPREKDLWFWLEFYGVTRNGLRAKEYVAKHGLPPDLKQLCDEVSGVDARAA